MRVEWQPTIDRPFSEPGVTLNPTHTIEFEGTDFIYAVDFSPDGSVCYCLVGARTINLWTLAVEWWPEILGGVAGIVVVLWLMWVVRVRRRPQRRGAPHCRRCNYEVTAQAPESVLPARARRMPAAGTLCPECGVDLSKRRPQRGRSMTRRVWIPTTVMLAVVLGYGAMLVLGVPREGWIGKELWVTSAWFDARARDGSWEWATKHGEPFTRIMAVETATGTVKRTVFTARGSPIRAMRVSPDGSHIALRAWRGRLLWINIARGRVDAQVRGVQGMPLNRERLIVGFDGPDDDPWVYYAAADAERSTSKLVRWRPSTGETTVVAEEPAFVVNPPASGRRTVQLRHYGLIQLPAGVASVSTPDFVATLSGTPFSVRFRAPQSEGSEVVRELSFAEDFFNFSPPMTVNGGGQVGLLTANDGVLLLDAQTGNRVAFIRLRVTDMPLGVTATDPSGRFIIVPVHGSVLVYDTADRGWSARLSLPRQHVALDVAMPANHRWTAVHTVRDAGGLGGLDRSSLMLYDMQRR